jgi:hypothetical protein
MTEQQFAYWLQGFAELNPQAPTQEQWQSIREHLATVFKKVTPEVKNAQPNIDLRNNEAIKRYFEKSKHDRTVPVPSMPNWPPYQPYSLDQSPKPGEIIC